MIKRYTSQFLSRTGHTWKVVISRLVDDPSHLAGYVEELKDFRFAPPYLVFEYAETEKHRAVIGSTCTVCVESPGDRTFVDLYADAPGDVLLQVYRDGVLYWCGSLDPEFYEEPYAAVDHYEVTLTFSDLGHLHDVEFDIEPEKFYNLAAYVSAGAKASGMRTKDASDSTHAAPSVTWDISLQTAGMPYNGITPPMVKVNAANFYDEEGEPMAWYDVLDDLLKPLSLRLCQVGGALRIFDIEALRTSTPELIEWASDNQNLTADKVYNKLSVLYSPYGATLCDASMPYDEVEIGEGPEPITYGIDLTDPDYAKGFRLETGADAGIKSKMNLVSGSGRYFKISKLLSGDDCAGIICLYCERTGQQAGHPPIFGDRDALSLNTDSDILAETKPTTALFEVPPARVERPILAERGALMKLTLEMLIDTRYNPYEQGNDNNSGAGYEDQSKGYNFVYVPARIWIETDDGEIYHLNNRNAKISGLSSDLAPAAWNNSGKGSWGEFWLAYYNWTDIGNKTGTGGWTTNKPLIGWGGTPQAPTAWQKRGEGEYLPMPPASGLLCVEIGVGVEIRRGGGRRVGLNSPACRWLAYRNFKLEAVDAIGKDFKDDDIEYSTKLKESAVEELSISTICGSVNDTMPSSRGVYHLTEGALANAPLYSLRRGGISAGIEQLLLCQLASQYDSRHTKLEGTVSNGGPLPVKIFTDRAQAAATRFMCTHAEYNARDDESEATFVELSAQKYTPDV